jgi:pentatricopeptide repeat protein
MWRLPANLHMDIACSYVKSGSSDRALDVLKAMVDADLAPSEAACRVIFRQALFSRDATVLRVLISWFKEKFCTRLELGELTRALNVAASQGDGQLASVAFEMLTSHSFPVTVDHYVSLVRALLLGRDLTSAIEALQEMQRVHPTETSGGNRYLRSIRDLLACRLGNTQELDNLYYALVDQVRSEIAVPRVVLDAMLVALGRQNQLDRVFASFQEYRVLFQVSPGQESYNALLQACASASQSSSRQLLAVMQSMDSAEGIAPDAESYSILLEHVLTKRDDALLDPLVQHVLDNDLALRLSALHKLILHFVNRQDQLKVDRLLERLRKLSIRQQVPEFLQKRVQRIPSSTKQQQPQQQEQQQQEPPSTVQHPRQARPSS